MVARPWKLIFRKLIDLTNFTNLKPAPQDMLLRGIFDKAPPARSFLNLLEEAEKQEQIADLHVLGFLDDLGLRPTGQTGVANPLGVDRQRG